MVPYKLSHDISHARHIDIIVSIIWRKKLRAKKFRDVFNPGPPHPGFCAALPLFLTRVRVAELPQDDPAARQWAQDPERVAILQSCGILLTWNQQGKKKAQRNSHWVSSFIDTHAHTCVLDINLRRWGSACLGASTGSHVTVEGTSEVLLGVCAGIGLARPVWPVG